MSPKRVHGIASAAGLILLASATGRGLAQSTQVTIPASSLFHPSPTFYELRSADVYTNADGGPLGPGVMAWYPWQTPRGSLEMRPEPFFDFLSVMFRSDIGETALLTPSAALGFESGFSFTQFFDVPGGAINGVSCRVGAQMDASGGPLIDSIITAIFDDGYSYSFPVSSAGLTYVGFYRPDGPDIRRVTFTASSGVVAINTFGIGTVPGPGPLCLLGVGGLFGVHRRRQGTIDP